MAPPVAGTVDTVRAAQATLPTRHGDFAVIAYRDIPSGKEHAAIVKGDVSGSDVLSRIHSECLTGDILGSLRCDCGPQLDRALAAIEAEGRGVVLYLRQEGRDIGFINKIKAYALQDDGHDTVDANLELGHPADARTYTSAADMLRDLGVTSVRLLTNNPAKVQALEDEGIQVVNRVPLAVGATEANQDYLATKRDRMGHALPATGQLENPDDE